MNRRYENDLEGIKNKARLMAALVEANVGLALKALRRRDALLAQRAVDADFDLDHMERDIDDDCLGLLVLHHPVAHPLRRLIALMKVSNTLERIGDFAVNLAEYALAHQEAPLPRVPAEVTEAERLLYAIVRNSLDAALDLDGARAYASLEACGNLTAFARRFTKRTCAEARELAEHPDAALFQVTVISRFEQIAQFAETAAQAILALCDDDEIPTVHVQGNQESPASPARHPDSWQASHSATS